MLTDCILHSIKRHFILNVYVNLSSSSIDSHSSSSSNPCTRQEVPIHLHHHCQEEADDAVDVGIHLDYPTDPGVDLVGIPVLAGHYRIEVDHRIRHGSAVDRIPDSGAGSGSVGIHLDCIAEVEELGTSYIAEEGELDSQSCSPVEGVGSAGRGHCTVEH